MLVNLWVNWLKPVISRLNDAIKGSEPRRPVPLFSSPEVLGEWMMRHVPYTGDPGGGTLDFYLHPERLMAAIEAGKAHTLSVDCDDHACLAFEALRLMGARPLLFTLIDGSGKFGHHVICGYGTPEGFGAIDTNGWRPLPNLTPSTLCEEWNRIYAPNGFRYVEAVPTQYPF